MNNIWWRVWICVWFWHGPHVANYRSSQCSILIVIIWFVSNISVAFFALFTESESCIEFEPSIDYVRIFSRSYSFLFRCYFFQLVYISVSFFFLLFVRQCVRVHGLVFNQFKFVIPCEINWKWRTCEQFETMSNNHWKRNSLLFCIEYCCRMLIEINWLVC